MSNPVLPIVEVGLVSIACQLLAHRMKIPAILPLLLAGIVLGPVLGQIDPDLIFGELFFPLVSLSVAIILFEGALTLNTRQLSGHGNMVRNLCSIGVLVTWLVVTPTAHFALGFDWPLAFLFGALVTVTGPTVIVPMLRTVRPTARVANILRWEGIIIDPIGALLAVLVYEFIVSSQSALLHTLQTFALTIAIGFGFGLASGWGLGYLLRRNLIPHYLQNTAVLTLMLGSYAISNQLAHESGLLTVTVMGLWLANQRKLDLEDILAFKETLSVLLISALFILLAARLSFSSILALGWSALTVLAIIIFIARPLAVLLSSWGTSLNWRELGLLSWIAPRGIVAAAVSSLFALKLEQSGHPQAELLVPMVFLVIISTVVLQSLTATPMARLLQVRAPAPRGFLLFGASNFSRQLARELISNKVQVMVADTNWEAISQARMANIPAYYGNPVSEHAQQTQDFSAIGRVLVMSPYRQLNPIVTYHFEHLLGKGAVLGLSTQGQDTLSSHQLSEEYNQKLGLFGDDISYSQLASLTSKGAKVKSTRLTDNFTMADYLDTYGQTTLPLCAIDPQGKVHLYSAKPRFKPEHDWLIISLVPAEVIAQVEKERIEQRAQERKRQSETSPE